MPAFQLPFKPVAYKGQAVELLPSGEVYRVEGVEQMARLGPVDFGSANSGNAATESGSSIIDLDTELEMSDNALGQFAINPLSRVEVEVRQTGDQDQRLVNNNSVGKITPYTPLNQRIVYAHEQEHPKVIVTNNQTWDMSKTLVYFNGWKLELSGDTLTQGQIEQLPGSPAAVPSDTFKGNNVGGGRP